MDWRVTGLTEVGELGAGAQGRVVLARHEESKLLVAIKYLYDTGQGAALLRGEAAMLRRVTDPNVARLYDFVENPGGGAALVMEAVDGVALREVLGRHGALPPEAALAVLKGSLLGLEAAHRVGVVHRDYKPANVLVRHDGRSKLIDFGVAVAAGTGSRSGTPAYMAPEQWRGDPAGPATDVYAATCVFFECVTGRRPFDGDTAQVLMARHVSAPVPVERLAGALRPLVARGMAKDAAARPPTAAAFVVELEALAVREYGAEWEERGVRRLAEATTALAALFSLATLTAATTAKTAFLGTVLGKAVLAVTAVTVVAGTGVGVYAVARGDTPPPPPPLAYATAAQVAVRSPGGGTRSLATLPPATDVSDLVMSGDHTRLAWIQTTWSNLPAGYTATVRVREADLRTGAARSWTCPANCNSLSFYRGDLIGSRLFLSEDPGAGRLVSILVFKPGSTTPAERPAADVLPLIRPAGFGSFYGTTPDEQDLLMSYSPDKATAADVLYRVDPHGRTTRLASVPALADFLLDPVTGPDGRHIAFSTTSGPGCPAAVMVVDLQGASAVQPVPPYAGAAAATGWFDQAGTAHATFTPSKPGSPCEMDTAHKADYIQEGNRWVSSSQLPGASQPHGWKAVLGDQTVTTPYGTHPDATLTITHPGTPTAAIPHVTAYTWPT